MTTTTIPTGDPDWHVLVLHDGQEKDILGIWGPYRDDNTARTALQELQNWPIDGQWTIFSCKQFQPPNYNNQPIRWTSPYTVAYTNTGEPIRVTDWWNGSTTPNG